MSLQGFIKDSLSLSKEIREQEISKHGKDKCPDCNRERKYWIRTVPFNTLECICGKKFYNE